MFLRSNPSPRLVSDANSWKTDIAQEIQDYMDNRSEKWQESEAAERYSSWKESFEEDIEQVEIERPEPLEVEKPEEITLDEVADAVEHMEQLPEELEG